MALTDVYSMLGWFDFINISLLVTVYCFLAYMLYITEHDVIVNMLRMLRSTYVIRKLNGGYCKVKQLLGSIWEMFNSNIICKREALDHRNKQTDRKKLHKKVRFDSSINSNEEKSCKHYTPKNEILNEQFKMSSVYMSETELTLSECMGFGIKEDNAVKTADQVCNSHGQINVDTVSIDSKNLTNGEIDNNDVNDIGMKIDELVLEMEGYLQIEQPYNADDGGDDVSKVSHGKSRKRFRKRFATWFRRKFLCCVSHSN